MMGACYRTGKNNNFVSIHKGGNILHPSNCRPVSLASEVVKLWEKFIKLRWMKHEEGN